jgi:serine/threonine protein phosphatase 1
MHTSLPPYQAFRKFPRNTKGRDFVIGDIHGAFNLVDLALKSVKFEAAVDRLFSVGDLVDRGPDSHLALDFLAKPGVYAVRGNHDDAIATSSLTEMRRLGRQNWNGMGWVVNASDETLLAIQAMFQELPIALQIETRRGTVGLVHAEVPVGMTWQEFIADIQSNDRHTLESALWGRDRIYSGDKSGVEGIGRVFSGHTIRWEGPQRFGNCFAIDTGAVFREIKFGDKPIGSLTMVNILCPAEEIFPDADRTSEYPIFTVTVEGEGSFSSEDSRLKLKKYSKEELSC